MKKHNIFNCILACTLILSLVLSMFVFSPVTISATETDVVSWSGDAALEFAGGDGTAASPYLIENADQLYKMVSEYYTYEASYGIYFKITKDIYINDVSDGTSIADLSGKKNWLAAYGKSIAAASKANSFNGTLDGDGHTIYGLYVNESNCAGLFPAIASYAVIKNLNFDNLLITGGNGYGGAIAGQGYYYYNSTSYGTAKITNCAATNATIGVEENIESAAAFLGSINDLSVTFDNCFSHNISLSCWNGLPGGIVGYAWSSGTLKINNCYTVGYFPTNSNVSKAVCTNVYTDTAIPEGNTTAGVTVLSDEQMKGEAAKTNLVGFDFKWTWDINENSYPTLKSDIVEVWDGTVASGVSDYKGSGTAADPYLIENGAQLAAATVAVKAVANSKYYFKLVKDIRLNDTTSANWKDTAKNWKWADVRFQGNFDGNGHIIDGLYYEGTQYRVGLFAYVGDSNIYNFKMTNAYIKNTRSDSNAVGVAFVAGQTSAATTFEEIYIDETCSIDAPNYSGAAAIVGRCTASATVKNCAVLGSISANSLVGAFLGKHEGGTLTITNSYTTLNSPLNGSGDLTNSSNNYGLVTDQFGTTVLTLDQMKGENAAKFMTGLSFRFVWETVENGYPILNPRGELWDGTWVTDFSSFEGEGTEEKPYLIKNGAQLAFALVKNSALNGGYHYKLVEDIILNDTRVDNWKNSATQWLHQTANRFVGVLDGDGHTIEGLYMNTSTKRPALVSYSEGTFKNINFIGASINYTGTSEPGVAIVAAQTSGPTNFEKIYIDESSEINSTAVKGVAALAGRGYNSTGKVSITNCAVLATINTEGTECGALTGSHWETAATVTIQNSFSISSLPLLGGTVALTNPLNNYSVTEDSYGTTVLTVDQMKGDNAKTYMSGLSFGRHWKIVENGYPVPVKYVLPDYIWDGTKADSFEGGSGTKDDPYLVANGGQLKKMVNDFTTSSNDGAFAELTYFKIVNDIYLNDVNDSDLVNPTVDSWTANGFNPWLTGYNYSQYTGFCGEIDGGGHTIYGVFCKEGTYGGFIPNVADTANVYNLNLKNSFIRAGGNGGAGALIGIVNGTSTNRSTVNVKGCTLDNVYVFSDNTSSWRCGGIVGGGYQEGKITVSECAVTNIEMVVTNTSTVKRTAPFIGNTSNSGHIVKDCYTDSSTHPITNADTQANYDVIRGNKTFTNVYTAASKPEWDSYGDITYITEEQMKGENAEVYMPLLHYGRYWKIVENNYPVPMIYVAPKDVWDGTVATSFDGFKGSGTEDAPYEIENGSQLAYVVSTDLTDGLYYKLVNDIKLNDTSDAQWTKSATNWVWANVRFVGNFNGDGHTIDGLYFNGAQGRFGLFSFIGDSDIYNFKMTNAYIYNTTDSSNGDTYQGASFIAGQTSAAANFDRVYIDESCYLEAPNAKGVGGFVGRGAYNVNITNSAVLATISGGSHVGSFFGTHWGGTQTVNNSFSASNAPIMSSRALSNSENNYATVLDGTYDTSVTLLTADQMKGEAAKENMSGLDFYCTWETVENGYPVLRKDGLDAWAGAPADTSAISYAGGNGTKASPYKIENGDQLYKMVAENSNADISVAPETQTYFEITADINLGNNQWYSLSYSGEWITNEKYNTIAFNGVIYGNGHTIYNLYSYEDAVAQALIPIATQLTEIYDLHIVGATIDRKYPSYAVGALIGLAKAQERSKPITIKGCSVEDSFIKGTNGVGGLIGYVYSQPVNVYDCYVINSELSYTGDSGANAAAFVGYMGGSEVGNSFVFENNYCDSINPLPYMNDLFKSNTTFKNVYTTNEDYDNSIDGLSKVTAAEITGDTAKENLNGFNFNQIWQAVEGGYPVHQSMEDRAKAWDGTVADGFAGGDGTAETPFLISNASQLYLLANSDRETTLGKYYKLTNDITISNVYDNWANENPYSWTKQKALLDGFTYTSSFAGVLDGAGYTVSGLYCEDEITDNGTYAYGLIPYATAGAVIRNLNVENVNINAIGNAYAGAVVGAAHVSVDDAENSLKYVNFVDVNVADCDITATNTSEILGGATRGVKFNRCEGETLASDSEKLIFNLECNEGLTVDNDALVYNSVNANATSLTAVRSVLLGLSNQKIADINCVEGFDIADLVAIDESINAQTPEESLVWSQEFNGDALDYSVWRKNTVMSKGSTLEYADNNTFSGESMTLSCKDTGKTDANGDKIYSVNYGLDTLNTMSFKYGRLEMRAKIPFGAGAFPSLWLVSRNALGNAPINEFDTEIDIFEVFGKQATNTKMITCIHKWYNDETGTRTGDECSCGSGWLAGNGYKVEEADRCYEITGNAKYDWHTVTFEWTEDTMTFAVDETVFYTAERSEMDSFDINGYDTNSDAIFNQFLTLRVNNHMYTTGDGAAYSYTGDASEIDASNLNYEIDYIRLYQKNDGKSQINLK